MNDIHTQGNNSKKYWIGAIIIAFILAYTAGYFSYGFLHPSNYPVLEQAVSIVENNGLKSMPTEPALEYGMIQGMLQAYGDPYTVFIAPPQNELQTEQLQGSYGGIGVRIGKDEQGNTLLYPLPGSNALASGIKDGDRLLAVDKLKITPQTSPDDIQAAIRGPVGQKVSITIGRSPDYQPVTLNIQRAQYALPSVTWNLTPESNQVGIIHVSIISSTTSDEIKKAFADLQSRGGRYFILDLRNNGGGLLNSGIDVARLFLKQGIIVDQQYRGQAVETFQAEQAGPLADVPLIVLINNGTASAAEIISGALHAQGRAKLVGSPSFGKDTIQLVFDLPGGASLHVTAAKWWIPGQAIPLQPDYNVPDDPNTDAVELKAVQILLGQ